MGEKVQQFGEQTNATNPIKWKPETNGLSAVLWVLGDELLKQHKEFPYKLHWHPGFFVS